MKTFFAIFTSLLLIYSCNTIKPSTNINRNNQMNTDYNDLKAGDKLYNFVGRKISFEAQISEIPAQHMMKALLNGGSEKEEYVYIDPAAKYSSNQIVAYFYPSKVQWPDNKMAAIRVYGSLSKLEGKGKGAAPYTEYYLDLDKVEEIK